MGSVAIRNAEQFIALGLGVNLVLQRLSSVYVALLLTVFLLAIPPGGYGVITEFKYMLFLLICGGYVVTTILCRTRRIFAEGSLLAQNRDYIRETSPAVFFLLIFGAFTFLSAVLSRYPGTFIGTFRKEGTLTIVIYIFMCIFLSKYLRPRLWMLGLFGLGLGLVCILSFVQLTGANPFGLYPPGHNFYGAGIYYCGVFLGTIGNVGLGAAFISLALGVLAMALIKLTNIHRWWLTIPFSLTVLLIFELSVGAALVALTLGTLFMLPVAVTNRYTLTNTLLVFALIFLGAFLSQLLVFGDGYVRFGHFSPSLNFAIVFLTLLAAIATKSKWLEEISAKNYRIATLIVIMLILCTTFLYLWFYNGHSSGMVWEASEVLRGNWNDTFGSRRIFIWRNVLENIHMETLLLGTGPDTLGYWPIEPFSRYIDAIGRTVFTGIDAAHNEYLHILATGGLLSLLSYMGALFWAMIKWLRAPDNTLSAISGTGMLFYFIQAFFGISQFLTAPFFWTCFAVFIHSQKTNGVRKREIFPSYSLTP